MQDQFENFYKQQIRKDLIDKLNACCVQDVDFSCVLSYKGYMASTPSDRNFKIMPSISLAYLYILESFLCQKVVRKIFTKKSIQRDLPSTFFFTFDCTLRQNKLLFEFLHRLFILLFFQQKKLKLFKKPIFKFFFNDKRLTLTNLYVSLSPWIKTFRVLEKNNKLFSKFNFSCPNPFLFYWVFSRLQFTGFITNNSLVHSSSSFSLKTQNKLGTYLKFKSSRISKKKEVK